jgi:plastocyanin
MARRWIMTISLLLAAPPARAGILRGTVAVPPAPRASAPIDRYPGHASAMPDAEPVRRGLVTDAVVYLESIAPEVDATLPHGGPRPQLAQSHQAFAPRVLPVAVGTTVDFPNRDPIYHNVFSVSPIKRFDLGKYRQGHSKSVTFNRTGLVNVFCDIHADMEAFVLVLPNHAFTQPDADGAYALPAVPPGHYVLHVWHPDFGDHARPVDVASDDAVVDLRY